jgi:hypothetical protein
MAALFSKPPKPPKIPERDDERIEQERRRKLASLKAGGRASTLLSGGAGITAPVLGSAAQLI